MLTWFQQKIDAWKHSGMLALVAALLFELLVVLWLSFLALFSLETLLPTFVTVRLSLTNFLAVLILGTLLYLSLEQKISDNHSVDTNTKLERWIRIGLWVFGALLLLLSLARFSLIGVIIFFFGYLALLWLLKHFHESAD